MIFSVLTRLAREIYQLKFDIFRLSLHLQALRAEKTCGLDGGRPSYDVPLIWTRRGGAWVAA